MKSQISKSLASGLLAAALGTSAHATTLFSSINPHPTAGGCDFDQACSSAYLGTSDDFAAEEVNLRRAATIDAIGISVYLPGPPATSINYAFYDVGVAHPGVFNNSRPIPRGTPFYSGSAAASSISGGLFGLTLQTFDIAPVTLPHGLFFLAIQAISPTPQVYLWQGLTDGGGAETLDGGLTWRPYYNAKYITSVSVAVYGDFLGGGGVPEAATWTMMLAGFGGLGMALRSRRRDGSAVAA